jgi:diguanylate cyclase (GGDEF)-like protein
VLLRVWEEQQIHDKVLESMGRGDSIDDSLRMLVALAEQETLQSVASIYRRTDESTPLVCTISATGAPAVPPLAGSAIGPGAAPWTVAAANQAPEIAASLDELPPVIAEAAVAAGFRACWAYPVHGQGTTDVIGVVALWRREVGRPEPTADWMIRRMVQLASLAISQSERSAQLEHAAHHDLLTDLPNRARFFGVLDEHLAARRERVGVLYLDLDGFKQVNDRYGHASGDEVLEEVATRLICATRSTDLVARLGGDEFAVLCPGTSDEGLVGTAERLIASIVDPIGSGPEPFHVGASVGIAVAEPGTSSADVLVDRADAALLVAKAGGKGTYRFG